MNKFTNFNFNMATEIVFGKSAEKNVADLIKKYGGTKVLLVYEGDISKKIGIYDKVVDSLKVGNLPLVEIFGIQPNPRRSLVEKGLKLAMDEKVNFILAVGGASTIDTGKAIALGVANQGNYWQFFSWNPNHTVPTKKTPIGAIDTIAAAGSETSFSIVILDDIDTGKKLNCNYVINRPSFAIMNPELTYTVPKFQTALGAVDILAHTFDRYFIDAYSHLGDAFCVSVMRNAVKYGPIAVSDPRNYEARAELMLTASMSHNDVTSIGRTGKQGSGHGLESQLCGTYDTPHGAGMAVCMPAYLEYLIKNGEDYHIARVAQFAVDVFDVEPDMGDIKEVARDGVRRFKVWIKSMGMPLTLKELGVPNPQNELDDIVAKCRCDANGILQGFMDLDKKAVRAIFETVLE
jgi:alcohol dehydrogenase YqhD (iron-dependent ADH family)